MSGANRPLAPAKIELLRAITADPASAPPALFAGLGRLLAAPAPANSCLLPGAVGAVIAAMAEEWGLDCRPIGATGNLGIGIGDSAAPPDLLVSAHMDRPCFRVIEGTERLYPLCAVRVPGTAYDCDGIALRYSEGAVGIAARGRLRFRARGAGPDIRFEAERGQLRAGDTLLMHAPPQLRAGLVVGAGLDNAVGVLLGLLCARMLKNYANLRGRKILFVFTDQEEGPPVGLFGQGAARLAGALPPPRLGFINIDAQNVRAARGLVPGVGAAHAFVSGRGRGAVVPLDWQARAEALAAAVNRQRPGTVRLNYNYVSRSDDMLLSAWARCLALIGVPLAQAHTGAETVALADIGAALHWISLFLAEACEA